MLALGGAAGGTALGAFQCSKDDGRWPLGAGWMPVFALGGACSAYLTAAASWRTTSLNRLVRGAYAGGKSIMPAVAGAGAAVGARAAVTGSAFVYVHLVSASFGLLLSTIPRDLCFGDIATAIMVATVQTAFLLIPFAVPVMFVLAPYTIIGAGAMSASGWVAGMVCGWRFKHRLICLGAAGLDEAIAGLLGGGIPGRMHGLLARGLRLSPLLTITALQFECCRAWWGAHSTLQVALPRDFGGQRDVFERSRSKFTEISREDSQEGAERPMRTEVKR